MRTRRSNRTKSYAVQEYHFGDSSEEDADATARRSNRAEEQDTNFDDEDAASADPGEDEEAGGDAAEEDEDENVSDAGSVQAVAQTPARRRGKAGATKARASQTPVAARRPAAPVGKKVKLAGGYMEIPLAAQEGSNQPKTYIGPNDRAVRRHHLVSAWYGPDEDSMATVQSLLDRWFQWPVLPPRASQDDSGVPSRGAWLDDYAGCESRHATAWRAKVEAAMGGRSPLRALSPAEAVPYQLPTDTMPVLVGPAATEEVLFAPGSGYAIAQSGIPFDYDKSDTREPSGWMLDAGGIVTGMAWAPRRREENAKQLLAVAVMPHADQEMHEFADEAAKMEFQAHGTVQLWEMQGEDEEATVAAAAESARPSSLPPTLRSTLCLPHGRGRRVQWDPIGSYLAVLCADGAVYVFEADTHSSGEYGKEGKQARPVYTC